MEERLCLCVVFLSPVRSPKSTSPQKTAEAGLWAHWCDDTSGRAWAGVIHCALLLQGFEEGVQKSPGPLLCLPTDCLAAVLNSFQEPLLPRDASIVFLLLKWGPFGNIVGTLSIFIANGGMVLFCWKGWSLQPCIDYWGLNDFSRTEYSFICPCRAILEITSGLRGGCCIKPFDKQIQFIGPIQTTLHSYFKQTGMISMPFQTSLMLLCWSCLPASSCTSPLPPWSSLWSPSKLILASLFLQL